MKLSFRKVIVPALALVALAFVADGSAIAEEVTRVFLFAGQSNMVGADAHADRINDYPNFKGEASCILRRLDDRRNIFGSVFRGNPAR